MAWDERKRIGDNLELSVARELTLRGWAVNAWGQGTFDEAVRVALRQTKSFARWLPDLVAARQRTVCFVDCKAHMTGRTSRRHAIERAAVQAHLQLVAWTNLPLYYVFDSLGVTTPYDVLAQGNDGPRQTTGSGAPYFLVGAASDRAFDAVFGPPPTRPATHAA